MYDAADSDPASLSGDESDAAHQTTSTAYATSWREAYMVWLEDKSDRSVWIVIMDDLKGGGEGDANEAAK